MLNEALRENNSTEKETVIRIRKFAYNHKSVFLKEFNRDLKLSLILFLNKTYPLTEFFTKVSISCFKEERGIERTDKREFSSPKKEERKGKKEEGLILRGGGARVTAVIQHGETMNV